MNIERGGILAARDSAPVNEFRSRAYGVSEYMSTARLGARLRGHLLARSRRRGNSPAIPRRDDTPGYDGRRLAG
jgi:hypothetical protein